MKLDPARLLAAAAHIELEHAWNEDDSLRLRAGFEHCEAKRCSAIDEDSAAIAALILNNPVSVAILPHQKGE
jgi:hypothetical protein